MVHGVYWRCSTTSGAAPSAVAPPLFCDPSLTPAVAISPCLACSLLIPVLPISSFRPNRSQPSQSARAVSISLCHLNQPLPSQAAPAVPISTLLGLCGPHPCVAVVHTCLRPPEGRRMSPLGHRRDATSGPTARSAGLASAPLLR